MSIWLLEFNVKRQNSQCSSLVSLLADDTVSLVLVSCNRAFSGCSCETTVPKLEGTVNSFILPSPPVWLKACNLRWWDWLLKCCATYVVELNFLPQIRQSRLTSSSGKALSLGGISDVHVKLKDSSKLSECSSFESFI